MIMKRVKSYAAEIRKDIYFVTSNPKKLKEVEAILGIKLKQANIDIKEIQSLDVREVAIDKAKKAFQLLKKPVIVEDTGLYITSLNGFPGALAKWVLRTIGTKKLCKIVGKKREAIARTCVCFFDGRECKAFVGEIRGKISLTPRGENGFGWDNIFVPIGHGKTFSEMGVKEKNKISMRKKALMKLKKDLLL